MVVPPPSISDYAWSNLDGATYNIIRLLIATDIFDLNPNFIQMVEQMYQFNGFQDEDFYTHLTTL